MIHHFLPFLLIFTLVMAITKSYFVAFAAKDICLKKCKIQSITMILAHLQLVFGIILFTQFAFSNPNWAAIMKDAASRYTYVEHPFLMLVAIILISVGKVKAKKIEDNAKSAKTTFIYFVIALVFILARTPFNKLLAF